MSKNKSEIISTVEETAEAGMSTYMHTTLTNRAIPNVFDGLKPVHKRALEAMYMDKNTSSNPYKKATRGVGLTMSMYHPHGDASIYDTVVNMARQWTTHSPLIDFHGNKGSISGDDPAAMRYTEIRTSKYAEDALLGDLKFGVADTQDNFDGSIKEVKHLPARFPNILVNGSFGIASAYACSIPSHNVEDIVNLFEAYITNMDISNTELANMIRPDYPTGGEIIDEKELTKCYETGVGKFTLRGKAEVVTQKNGKEYIKITEIPYGTTSDNVINSIRSQAEKGNVQGITTMEDESAKGKINIVFNIHRDHSAEVTLNQMYKYTGLQSTMTFSMIALNRDGKYIQFSIKELIQEWLYMRSVIVKRKFNNVVRKNSDRIHIIEGIQIALDNINDVIKMIQDSKYSKDINLLYTDLCKKYKLTLAQATAIVNIKLRALSKMDVNLLADEKAELEKENNKVLTLLSSNVESNINKVILDEMKIIAKVHNQPIKTVLSNLDTSITTEDLIDDKQYLLVYTRNGFVKKVEHSFSNQKQGGKGISVGKIKPNDVLTEMMYINSKDTILAFTDKGHSYKVNAWDIPEVKSLKVIGNPFSSFIKLKDGEKVVKLTIIDGMKENEDLIFATKRGMIKRTSLGEFKNIGKAGLIAININKGDFLLDVLHSKSIDNSVLLSTLHGDAIHIQVKDIARIKRATIGVKGITMDDEANQLVAMQLIGPEDYGDILVITKDGYGKKVDIEEFPLQNRGGKGRILNKLKPGDSIAFSLFINEEDDTNKDVTVYTDKKVMQTSLGNIKTYQRSTFGHKIINPDEGSYVIGFSLV